MDQSFKDRKSAGATRLSQHNLTTKNVTNNKAPLEFSVYRGALDGSTIETNDYDWGGVSGLYLFNNSVDGAFTTVNLTLTMYKDGTVFGAPITVAVPAVAADGHSFIQITDWTEEYMLSADYVKASIPLPNVADSKVVIKLVKFPQV